MSKILEVIDSLNDENITPEAREALKSEAIALDKHNSQLYQRAKKAEGFEFDKGTKQWVKKEHSAEKTENKNPNEFDYGQKAFISNVLGVKITDSEQMALVNEYLGTGKKLDDLIDNKHFQNDLKDLMENQATKEATPSGTKRTGQSTNDTVEYWLAKGELPPTSNPLLRQQVVNARYNSEKNAKMFTDRPVG